MTIRFKFLKIHYFRLENRLKYLKVLCNKSTEPELSWKVSLCWFFRLLFYKEARQSNFPILHGSAVLKV